MTVYLLHFDRRYRHAGHYTGSADDLEARLAKHASGQGARLMAVVKEAGIGWQLARTWPGGRRRERQIKSQGGASRHCPMCGVKPQRQAEPAAGTFDQGESSEPRSAAAGRTWLPDPAPVYEFEDWPMLTGALSAREAAELTDQLSQGAQAAYDAAAQAWSTDEHTARFDTATEVDMAQMKLARETTEIHGRGPAEPVNDWIARTRQAEQAGAETASQIVTAQAEAGMSPDRIGAHHEDLAAGLLSDATTADGQAFAAAYDDTAATLAAELRRDADREPAAASLPDGTPHADAFLAGRGWHVDRGMYTRREPTERAYHDQLTALADRQAVPDRELEAG